jgi:hypothetical protein
MDTGLAVLTVEMKDRWTEPHSALCLGDPKDPDLAELTEPTMEKRIAYHLDLD